MSIEKSAFKQQLTIAEFNSDFSGLEAALAWLVQATSLPRQGVLCLGLRLEAFEAGITGNIREKHLRLTHALSSITVSELVGNSLGNSVPNSVPYSVPYSVPNSAPPAPLLSASEREHAERFVRQEDRLRHLLGRALLRAFLVRGEVGEEAAEGEAGAARIPPLPQCWPCNPWGKPMGGDWGVEFNLSHAGAEVWLALSREFAVGLDVEQEAPALADLEGVCHPAELAGLREPHHDAMARRRLWARKEAVIKADGRGLSLPLADFEVAVDARREHWLLAPPADSGGAWSVCDLVVAGSPALALAVRGEVTQVEIRLASLGVGIQPDPHPPA